MIDSIQIASIATYGPTPEVMSGLAMFNYIFGCNGSGKTTISRIIANEINFPSCAVTWKGGTKLQTMAYNRDFVARNFHQSAELKGIFTLGEQNVDTLNKITAAKVDLDALTKKLEGLKKTLGGDDGTGGKNGELSTLENAFRDKCWAQKRKHDAKLLGAFEGLRNNTENFKARVLKESATNAASLRTLSELERRAETVFGATPSVENSVPTISAVKLIGHESNPILSKKVIGKDDVDIAAMIKKLSNSDWVREGRTFFDANEGACPFCQQATPATFAKSLGDYFDEAFERDSKAISDLSSNYKTDGERLQQVLAAMIASPFRFLDVEKMKGEKALLDTKLALNNQRVDAKKKEPSQVVGLDSIANVISAIEALIKSANDQVSAHNKTVANLAQERKDLTEQIWKYLLESELKSDLTTYAAQRDAINKARLAIEKQIVTTTAEKTAKAAEIRALEKQTTSIQPAIDGINTLLASFGFRSFSIKKADNGTSYKLIRPDGTDAKETLSEGEQSFVTFLYFYHLLKGSDSETGMTTNRVVVFDDPVSSLDSDILFVVGALIKGLFDEMRVGVGYIKQLFVLTHNVYFHKEVTFNPRRTNDAMNEESFWIIRKSELVSKLERHPSNPIKTSYELLWIEVRRQDRSNLSIQNTLRRILENYFRILGSIDPDAICALFVGKEKLVCKSLFSWVNAGSHDAHDDLYISLGDATVETYLNVFKMIFEKTDHMAHYKMMMGDAYVELPPTIPS